MNFWWEGKIVKAFQRTVRQFFFLIQLNIYHMAQQLHTWASLPEKNESGSPPVLKNVHSGSASSSQNHRQSKGPSNTVEYNPGITQEDCSGGPPRSTDREKTTQEHYPEVLKSETSMHGTTQLDLRTLLT